MAQKIKMNADYRFGTLKELFFGTNRKKHMGAEKIKTPATRAQQHTCIKVNYAWNIRNFDKGVF